MRRHQKTTTARGYGAPHQRLRERWALLVDRGEVTCGRCGYLIPAGCPWDLSHPGDDKTMAPVPWHSRCNRSYAVTVTKRRRQLPRNRGTSRPW